MDCDFGADMGETYAWGNGNNGRLGTGSTEHQLYPKLLVNPVTEEPYRFSAVSCGDFHTLAITGATV